MLINKENGSLDITWEIIDRLINDLFNFFAAEDPENALMPYHFRQSRVEFWMLMDYLDELRKATETFRERADSF